MPLIITVLRSQLIIWGCTTHWLPSTRMAVQSRKVKAILFLPEEAQRDLRRKEYPGLKKPQSLSCSLTADLLKLPRTFHNHMWLGLESFSRRQSCSSTKLCPQGPRMASEMTAPTPPHKLLKIMPWIPGSSTKTSNPYKGQLWLVCSSTAQLRGPYVPSAPWVHVKIACNVWIDTLGSPSNWEMQPKTDGIRFAVPSPCCTGTAGHTRWQGVPCLTTALPPSLLGPGPLQTATAVKRASYSFTFKTLHAAKYLAQAMQLK